MVYSTVHYMGTPWNHDYTGQAGHGRGRLLGNDDQHKLFIILLIYSYDYYLKFVHILILQVFLYSSSEKNVPENLGIHLYYQQ